MAIDENKPSGSIKIRVETIGYFLACYRERLLHRGKPRTEAVPAAVPVPVSELATIELAATLTED